MVVEVMLLVVGLLVVVETAIVVEAETATVVVVSAAPPPQPAATRPSTRIAAAARRTTPPPRPTLHPAPGRRRPTRLALVGHSAGLDMFLQFDEGKVIDHIVIYDRDAAATALGINQGARRRALDFAYAGHVVKAVEDDFYGTFVYVDLGRHAAADMVAGFEGSGSTGPITAIYIPAVVIEGGCL